MERTVKAEDALSKEILAHENLAGGTARLPQTRGAALQHSAEAI